MQGAAAPPSEGEEAQEGEIAALCHTGPLAGADMDDLRRALEDIYAADGLTCRLRGFKSIAELREAGPTIAVVKYRFMVDHCVAVLDVTDDEVVVGDPLVGKRTLSHAQFEDMWRFRGVVLSMEEPRGR